MTEKNGDSKKMSEAKENRNAKNKNSKKAFEQAEEDIENDPDTKSNKDDNLDEGERARKEGHR